MKTPWSPAMIARALDGDRELLNRLYTELTPIIHAAAGHAAKRYASAKLRADPDLVLDLVQRVSEELLRARAATLRRWDPARGRLTTYIWRVTFNKTITWTTRAARRGARLRVKGAHDEAVDHLTERSSDRLLARDELQRLSAYLKEHVNEQGLAAFTLKFIDGLSSAEIGELLGMSPNTVDARISRIRKRVRAWREGD